MENDLNCSVVKVNNENNLSDDCTVGQASGGNSSANISAVMVKVLCFLQFLKNTKYVWIVLNLF